MALCLLACEPVEIKTEEKQMEEDIPITLSDVACMLGNLPIGREQVGEVHDAVSASSENGYDEEYLMRDLLNSPGAGVGDAEGTKASETYSFPLKDMIRDYLQHSLSTKASAMSADRYEALLEKSGYQIYWPYSEEWDGQTLPVITFAPENSEAASNVGYLLEIVDGERRVREVVVDEEMAMTRPVWVINSNEDSAYTTLEMLRAQDPDWGKGNGGSIVIGKKDDSASLGTKAESRVRTLMLKDFMMKRNFDSWFAGASEFFIKTGAVENFTASTEAELALYSPTITDFMLVVKRKNVGKTVPVDIVLVSDWTEQLTDCAFMIIEDDGGTKESWKCSANVKYQSKSYGFEVNLPLNSKDDIVWRGQLSARYLSTSDIVKGHFGDVELSFESVYH